MAYNTIKLKKYSDVVEEITATAVAITPGMLLELASATTVQAHSTVAGDALPMFALENELEGDGIDDAYVASEKIQVWIPNRGDVVYALLADGQNVSAGDLLVSNGDGYLQKYAASSGSWEFPLSIVGQAIEALDLSSSSGAEPTQRIKVRIA